MTVLIPTWNRVGLLLRTLACLEAQTFTDFEVVVIDDGSTDGTAAAVDTFMRATSLAIVFARQANAGPARARNAGLARVRTPVVVMIGDDTPPEPGFVAAHAAFHRAHPEPFGAAVGHTRWCEEGQTVTPFMRWLDTDGIQFEYRSLLAGGRADWRHFYTSNLSAKTAFLGRDPFDERFPTAAMEDIEAGYRLQVEHGLTMTFLPDAVTRHVHPLDFAAACRRAVGVGQSKAMFHAIWPEHRARPMGRAKRGLVAVAARLPMLRATVVRTVGWWTRWRGTFDAAYAVIRLHERIGMRAAPVQPATTSFTSVPAGSGAPASRPFSVTNRSRRRSG